MLRGIGAGIALPMLDAMLDDRGLLHGTAYAAPTPPPVRLVTFFFPNGFGNMTPADNFFRIVNGPLAPFAGDMVVLKNLDKKAQHEDRPAGTRFEPHGAGHCTFATGDGFVNGGAAERALFVSRGLGFLPGTPDVLDDAVRGLLRGGRREIDVDGHARGEREAGGGEGGGDPAHHGCHLGLRG